MVAKKPVKKKPNKKPLKKNTAHIRVHYPPSKAHLYPKSHPSYRPKKK